MFKATILNPKRTLIEKEVFSIFLPGTEGEFEVMQFHKPLIALLKSGHIIINWEEALKIRKGVVMVHQDELIAMVEE
jgi:F0F1-type ATP synthase epsilon subunit